MPESFYSRDGDRLLATELTRGPWSSTLQHGGPPAALLAQAIERAEPEPDRFTVARLTFEFLRPVPIGAFEVRTETVRAGRQAQRLAGALVHDGVELLRVHALRIRRAQVAMLHHKRALRENVHVAWRSLRKNNGRQAVAGERDGRRLERKIYCLQSAVAPVDQIGKQLGGHGRIVPGLRDHR